MNGLTVLKAMSGIDERFVAEAVPEKEKGKLFAFVKAAAAVAACICLVAGGVYAYKSFQNSQLPMLELEEIDFGGMGFEGSDSLALEHSDDISPWNEQIKIDKLPVYKNLLYRYEGQEKSYFSEEDLLKVAQEYSKLLGEKIISYEKFTDDFNEKIVRNVIAQTQNHQISVGGDGGVSIVFKNPEGLTDLSAVKVKYPFLFDENDVTGKYQNFTVDGEPFGDGYKKYTKGETVEQSVVNYTLKNMRFTHSENGEIRSVNINAQQRFSEKLGDYPVISFDEAKEKLLDGQYVSSVDEVSYISSGRVEERLIRKVDIIYYTGNNQQLFMPYYRFYIWLDLRPFVTTGLPEDYEEYGYFYVPAVPEEYFVNYELFDGSFQ
ncbi:MAG: hypothetical protein IKL41_04630 [Clostridia bacterium]|nr:hypothetical protein [Clostridia bacterium]MBR6634890.1 hypothetical protein [Clostridia bacterium]